MHFVLSQIYLGPASPRTIFQKDILCCKGYASCIIFIILTILLGMSTCKHKINANLPQLFYFAISAAHESANFSDLKDFALTVTTLQIAQIRHFWATETTK